jgi:hypothetical protein
MSRGKNLMKSLLTGKYKLKPRMTESSVLINPKKNAVSVNNVNKVA